MSCAVLHQPESSSAEQQQEKQRRHDGVRLEDELNSCWELGIQQHRLPTTQVSVHQQMDLRGAATLEPAVVHTCYRTESV